tara:strand:+ start:679 stop:891 length:213 start_codon:yes stop_codon:yes gene_type:complete
MPTVHFPYGPEGEAAAREAAKRHGGKYVPDKKKDKGSGMSIAIVVGSEQPTKKKAPKKKTPRRTRRNKKA